MVLQSGQRAGGGGAVPPSVYVEIAKDPEKFDRRLTEFQEARAAAIEAKREAEEARREAEKAREELATDRAAFEKERREVNAGFEETTKKLDEQVTELHKGVDELTKEKADLAKAQQQLASERAAFKAETRSQERARARTSNDMAELARRQEESRAALAAQKKGLEEGVQRLRAIEEQLRVFLAG